MRIAAPPRPRRRIVSLVPMVDVVMNLLFFFMLATTYAHLKPVALSLAGPAVAGAPVAPPRLRVGASSIALDGQTLDWPAALDRLKSRAVPAVIVEPAAGLPVQPLLDALDRLRAAGVSASLARGAP